MRWFTSVVLGSVTSLIALGSNAEEATPEPNEAEVSEPAPEGFAGGETDSSAPEPEPEPLPPPPEVEPEPAPPPPEIVAEPLPPPEIEPPPPRTGTVVRPELQQPGEEEEEEDAESETREGGEGEQGGRTRLGAEETWNDALPFRGTRLVYENVFNAAQLRRDNELTYNPYYAMSLSILPRWYFTDELSIRLRFDIEGELTDADDTTDYHETRVGDLYVDLVYNPIVTIPTLEVDVGAGLRLQFPTSLESQFETRYLGLGPDLRLARTFDVLDGLVIGYVFRYMKYLNRYTTTELGTHPLGGCPTNDVECQALIQDGSAARSHGFFNNLFIELDFARRLRPMSLTFDLLFINYLTYELPEYEVSIMGDQTVPVEHIDDPQRHQAALWFVVDYSIELTDYLAASIGLSTLWPQLAPDSTYRTPLFNRYTNVYVDLSLDIERLVAAVRR